GHGSGGARLLGVRRLAALGRGTSSSGVLRRCAAGFGGLGLGAVGWGRDRRGGTVRGLADGRLLYRGQHFPGVDAHVPDALVQFHPGVPEGTGGAVVRREQGLLDRADKGLHRNVSFPFHHPQGGHIDVHTGSSHLPAPPAGRNSTSMRPLTTWARGTLTLPDFAARTTSSSVTCSTLPECLPASVVIVTKWPWARRKCRAVVRSRPRPGVVTSSR